MDEITVSGTTYFGCSNSLTGWDRCATSTVLTSDSFTFDGTSHAITVVSLTGAGSTSSLSISLASGVSWPSAIRTGGQLIVGTTKLSFSDASFRNSNRTADWSNTGITWTDNQVVALSITLPGVSNITQTAHRTNTPVNGDRQRANAFTTGGSASDRFTLNSVVLDLASGGTGEIDVSIHEASTTNASNPGTKIGTLTGTAAAGNTTYTASGITLAGATTYFVNVTRRSASGD